MYIAYTDIATYLNIDLVDHPEGQAVVNQLITLVSAFVDNYCNRTWTNVNTMQLTETFDGGREKYFVATPPILAIVSVAIDQQVQNTNYYYNYGSYVQMFEPTRKDFQNVVIVYTTSANTIPADLKQALIQWVAQMFKESDDAGKQTTRYQQGPVQVYFKEQGDIPDFVMRVLEIYRLAPSF